MPSCHSLPAEGGQDHAAMGHEAHADMAKGQPAADAAEEARLRIPDMDLLDQDGRPVHFYRDLVEDKVVAMNFIFTTCTTICPPMGANFSRLQEALGEHLGRDVQLISVSIDPTTDTPQRLKAWGEKFSASDAWTLVTGPKPDVDQVLRQLEVLSPDFKDHGPVALLINDRTGAVRRVNGLTPPAKLAAMLEEMMDTPEAPTEETAR
ncbi:MAG: SCO family protein [Acidobacteria bacterium]|nr:SCO family protein [Acidobacteriota bacterium]